MVRAARSGERQLRPIDGARAVIVLGAVAVVAERPDDGVDLVARGEVAVDELLVDVRQDGARRSQGEEQGGAAGEGLEVAPEAARQERDGAARGAGPCRLPT